MNRGYCTTTDGRDTKPFRFDNTREGLDTLWSMIVVNKNRFRCREVIVGYESTGPYGEPIGHYLAKKPVKVVRVNPMPTKRVKEINDNSLYLETLAYILVYMEKNTGIKLVLL
jgi:transposase